MVGYISSKNRTVLTAVPQPPHDFVNISDENQRPGQYLLGQNTFTPNMSIGTSGLSSRSLDGGTEEIILGFLSIILIMTITEIVLTILSRKRPNRDPEKSDFALLAIRVDGLLHFNGKWITLRDRSSSSRRRNKNIVMTLCAVVVASLIFLVDMGAVVLTQPKQYSSKAYNYNLKGIHPIGSDLGRGKFLRRNAMERPCVTPVFLRSNPSRNFSLSVCHTLKLKKAHSRVRDSVSFVKIGSWFHKGGSNHQITFGNASIKITTRAFLYGAEGGTRRLLFPNLYQNYMSFTHYLHQVLVYTILEENCNNKDSMESCENAVTEHRTEANPVKKVINLWMTRNGRATEDVQGLETTLRFTINTRPWLTVFKSIGPLMTAELIEEVEGPALYSHLTTEETEDGIPGLIVEERRPLGVFTMLFCTLFMLLTLVGLKRILRPVFLADRAWDNYEKTVLSNLETESKSSSDFVNLGIEVMLDGKSSAEDTSFQTPGTSSGDPNSLFPKTIRSGSKAKDGL
ncbi:unnamed protein product [Agarophyton chilense]